MPRRQYAWHAVIGFGSLLEAGFCTLTFAVVMIIMSPRGSALAAKYDPHNGIDPLLCLLPAWPTPVAGA